MGPWGLMVSHQSPLSCFLIEPEPLGRSMVVWVVLTLLLAPALGTQAVANYGHTTVSAGAWAEREKVGTGGTVESGPNRANFGFLFLNLLLVFLFFMNCYVPLELINAFQRYSTHSVHRKCRLNGLQALEWVGWKSHHPFGSQV